MICKICQIEFYTDRHNRKVCSNKCSEDNKKRIKREYYLRNIDLVKLRSRKMVESGYKWVPSDDKKAKYSEKRNEYSRIYKLKNSDKYKESNGLYNNTEERKKYMKQYFQNNKERIKNHAKKYREKPLVKGDREDYHLRKNFGINRQQYDVMSMAQNHICLICKQPETKVIRGKVARLSVDHCHKTGKVRGLLCSRCNLGIGRFDENVEILENAINYLNQHKE